jgi:hypothetical protein
MPPNLFSSLFGEKLPRTLPVTLGWELEFSSHQRSDFLTGGIWGDATLTPETAACFKESDPPEVKSEHCGVEFCSPIISDFESANTYLKEFGSLIRKQGLRVNTDCGGHIHIGIEGWAPEDLSRLLIGIRLCQNFFFRCCPKSRHDNEFCQRTPASEHTRYLTAVRQSAPALLDSEKYDEVVEGLPPSQQPKSKTSLMFSPAGKAAGDRSQTWYNPIQHHFPERLQPICQPQYALGLPLLKWDSNNRAVPYHFGLSFPWLRVQHEYPTIEFRCMPASNDMKEWAYYLAIVTWFAHRFRKNSKVAMTQLLGREDDEILNGDLPFSDFPPLLIEWWESRTNKYKYPDQHAPNKIARATVAA